MQIRLLSVVFMVLGLTPAAFAIVNPPFDDLLRGDANNDLRVDLSDPTAINSWLFNGQPGPVCLDAADANDDGAVDISDAIHLFNYLFLGGLSPRPPFPYCGPDTTPDSLDCFSSACH
jgi:hypothetical protein